MSVSDLFKVTKSKEKSTFDFGSDEPKRQKTPEEIIRDFSPVEAKGDEEAKKIFAEIIPIRELHDSLQKSAKKRSINTDTASDDQLRDLVMDTLTDDLFNPIEFGKRLVSSLALKAEIEGAEMQNFVSSVVLVDQLAVKLKKGEKFTRGEAAAVCLEHAVAMEKIVESVSDDYLSALQTAYMMCNGGAIMELFAKEPDGGDRPDKLMVLVSEKS